MQNNPQENSSSSTRSGQSPALLQNWIAPICCAVITTAGVAYTSYSSQKTQSEIEALRTNSEQQIAKIKTATEKEIKQAELRSQADIIRLQDQLESEKELRSQKAANESAYLSARAKRCEEIKTLRDSMSNNIAHLRHNDPKTEDALVSLDAASNKVTSYLTNAGFSAFKSALPKNEVQDGLQRFRNYYTAIVEGFNAELRTTCN